MRFGFTYDLKDNYIKNGFSKEEAAEFDSIDTIEAIEGELKRLGHDVERIGDITMLVHRLSEGRRWDMVFNICEGVYGYGREAQVPALLDAHKIPYVFADTLTLSVTLHKGMTKRIVRDHGINTSNFFEVNEINDTKNHNLEFPLFCKPIAEGTSKGVFATSKVNNQKELEANCKKLLDMYKNQSILVEEYLPGREFTVGLVGTGKNAKVVGIVEVVVNKDLNVDYTYEIKQDYTYEANQKYDDIVKYVRVDDPIAKKGALLALKAWRVLNCRDGGRVDIKVDKLGNPSFIEVNPLAGLNPKISDLPLLCYAHDITYSQLFDMIVASAIERTIYAEKREKVVVMYDNVRFNPSMDDIDTLLRANIVCDTLIKLGYAPTRLPIKKISDMSRLKGTKDLVFNLVEEIDGSLKESYLVPKTLEEYGLQFTGNGSFAMEVACDKVRSKQMLLDNKIMTGSYVSSNNTKLFKPGTKYILKPVNECASKGISEHGVFVANTLDEVLAKINEWQKKYGFVYFADEYIDGREITCNVIGGEMLLPREILFKDFGDRPKILNYESKWDENSDDYKNTPEKDFDIIAEKQLFEKIKTAVNQTWKVLKLGGYARIDFRVDKTGTPYVMEVNPNPCTGIEMFTLDALPKTVKITMKQKIESIIKAAKKVK